MELLSPAGNMDALISAVQNGADAVYLGFGEFNARRSAGNFVGDEFRRAVDYCHLHGVKVHVTLNTLLKQGEFDAFCDAAREAEAAGADAAIVQDLGGARAIRALCPGLKLHMSTQAACCNAQGVRFAIENGYDRVVLARECSLDEIRRCAETGAEIETFAHGALCVCFSGQCLFSSMVGGRSGNRGMCAQPCRLPYRLAGSAEASGYLLSPKDIMMLGDLKALKDAGVCSLKIEGRLKRPEYVAEVTRVYRRALDALEEHPEYFEPDAADFEALRQIFNRGGFSRAYLSADFRDSDIMSPDRPNNMGVKIGEAAGARRGRLQIELETPIEAGDQISLRAGELETGFEAKAPIARGVAAIDMPNGANAQDYSDAGIFRTASSAQLSRAAQSAAGEHRPLRIDMRARIIAGEPASLTIRAARAVENADISAVEGSAAGQQVAPARSAPLTREGVIAQLTRFGGTPFASENVDIELSDGAFMSVSALNALRREAVDKFTEGVLRGRAGRVEAQAAAAFSQPRRAWSDGAGGKIRLAVQAYDIALADGADIFYWQPRYASEEYILSEVKKAADAGAEVCLFVPNMLTSAELDEFNRAALRLSGQISGVVLTNISQLALDWPGKVIADQSLNIWNGASAEIIEGCGIGRIAAPLELTSGEISGMRLPDGLERELIVYGRATLMTMRHCPVNAQSDVPHAACRRCESGHGAQGSMLIDRKSAAFPLTRYRGESGCYVCVLNSATLDVLGQLKKLPRCDVMRMIFTDETKSRADELIDAARRIISGGSADYSPAPVPTRGHYFRKID